MTILSKGALNRHTNIESLDMLIHEGGINIWDILKFILNI